MTFLVSKLPLLNAPALTVLLKCHCRNTIYK